MYLKGLPLFKILQATVLFFQLGMIISIFDADTISPEICQLFYPETGVIKDKGKRQNLALVNDSTVFLQMSAKP
jgi:hypothetical protein